MIWKCEYCGNELPSRNELYIHKRAEHGVRNGFQKKITAHCKFCNKELSTKSCLTRHEKTCINNPSRIKSKGHPVSIETKKKISESMHNAALEGRNRGWSTSRQGIERKSYPEKWFTSVIQDRFDDKNFEYNLPFFTWKLDFAWSNKRLCIEIDGSQHKNPSQQESDTRKDKKLKELEWKVLRLDWSYIVNNKEEAIILANDFINSGIVHEVAWVNPKVLKKEKREQAKQKASEEGTLDSKGRFNPSCLPNDTWEIRRRLILTCGVDLTKHGWISKAIALTGLTKRQIEKTKKHFKEDFFVSNEQV
jgi:very-short-patch-repair endonuclease